MITYKLWFNSPSCLYYSLRIKSHFYLRFWNRRPIYYVNNINNNINKYTCGLCALNSPLCLLFFHYICNVFLHIAQYFVQRTEPRSNYIYVQPQVFLYVNCSCIWSMVWYFVLYCIFCLCKHVCEINILNWIEYFVHFIPRIAQYEYMNCMFFDCTRGNGFLSLFDPDRICFK